MMTVSHYTTETIFDYSWFQVVQAFWQRYPNPSSKHVLTEDTIKRDVYAGKLYSRRLFSKTNSVPKWGERFYKNTSVKILEDSILDLKNKTLITFTRNIGLQKIMKVAEIVEYSAQNDGRTTKAIRRAYITSQVFGFSRAIRAFGIERFKANCQKAAYGFDYVLKRMFPKNQFQQQQQQHLQNQQRFNHLLLPMNGISCNNVIAKQKLLWLKSFINYQCRPQTNWKLLNIPPQTGYHGSTKIGQLLRRKCFSLKNSNYGSFKLIRSCLDRHVSYRRWLLWLMAKKQKILRDV